MINMFLSFLFILKDWSNLLLVGVGLSAFIVYFIQKRDKKRAAAMIIKGQIDSIEKCLMDLKSDYQLNNISIYHSKIILKDNFWEKYKYLLLNNFSQSEVSCIQDFFDAAEHIEFARSNIVNMMKLSWENKARVEMDVIGAYIKEMPNMERTNPVIQQFEMCYRPFDIGYVPDFVFNTLVKQLNDINVLSGTTAYQKIQRISYGRR